MRARVAQILGAAWKEAGIGWVEGWTSHEKDGCLPRGDGHPCELGSIPTTSLATSSDQGNGRGLLWKDGTRSQRP
jgi:hypothetical protein